MRPLTEEPDPGLLLERLLAVVDEGRRTGTHKLLALLGLIDAAQASVGPDLEPAPALPVTAVAERVLDVLWPHAVPYAVGDDARVLSQMNDDRRNVLLDAAAAARDVAEERGLRSADQLRARASGEHRRAVTRITTQLVRYPLALLQRIDDTTPDFLFEGWPSESSATRVAAAQGEPEPMIRWVPGAAVALVRYAALLRPLIELEVVRDIARWNRLATEEERLRAHLFGASRRSWPDRLRETLYEIQDGRCFYDPEGPRLGLADLDVDHFLPWRRFHHDSFENLVLARSGRNASKSDLFAGTVHVRRWSTTLPQRVAAATRIDWDITPERTMALARAGYGTLPEGSPLWIGLDARTQKRKVEPLTSRSRHQIVSALDVTRDLEAALAAEDVSDYQ